MAHTLKNLLETFISQENNWHLDLVRNWNSIMGHLHTKVQLEKIEEDTLTLGVFDSCWLQELYLLSPLLIKTINKNLDQPRIKQLRFKKIGTFKQQPKKKKLVAPREIKEIKLSRIEQEALNDIADEQLRTALRTFLIRCYQERN